AKQLESDRKVQADKAAELQSQLVELRKQLADMHASSQSHLSDTDSLSKRLAEMQAASEQSAASAKQLESDRKVQADKAAELQSQLVELRKQLADMHASSQSH